MMCVSSSHVWIVILFHLTLGFEIEKEKFIQQCLTIIENILLLRDASSMLFFYRFNIFDQFNASIFLIRSKCYEPSDPIITMIDHYNQQNESCASYVVTITSILLLAALIR